PAAEVYQKVTLYQFMPKFAIKPVNIEARKYSQLRCSYLEEVEAEFHIEPLKLIVRGVRSQKL
ncbi:MAG: hypothetical protein LC633_08925, partial [Desulfobulbaceae bacterium]|nr:hypothetical protein [Desulfobulbaceae bacterium]